MCAEDQDACVECLSDSDCDDFLFCTGGETCSGGECRPGADPCPGRMCAEDQDACVECLEDADCADGLFCNGPETCAGGACRPGPLPCAADELDCTVTCDEGSDRCNAVLSGYCAIGGSCFAHGAMNPANPCPECISSAANTSWSDDDSNVCDDQDPCTEDMYCRSGECVAGRNVCDAGGCSCGTGGPGGAIPLSALLLLVFSAAGRHARRSFRTRRSRRRW
jgi:hypothetical protein